MRRFEGNRGTALIIAIGCLAVLTLFSSGFLVLLHRTADALRRDRLQQQCLILAEAGIEKAVAELRLRPDTYRGEEKTPLGTGRFSVTVERDPGPGTFWIRATGDAVDGDQVIWQESRAVRLRLTSGGAVAKLEWGVALENAQ